VESEGQPVSDVILSVKNLSVSYGRSIRAVSGVSFDLNKGETLGIIGANGAGKTTLVRAICGMVPGLPASISGGQILFGGRDVTRQRASTMVHRGISFVPERNKVFVNLTIREHIRVAERFARGPQPKDLKDVFADLLGKQDDAAGGLSGGQRQLLALMCAIVRQPALLVVDEFSLGLSPAAVRRVADIVRWVQDRGDMSLMIVEQDAALVTSLCDRVAVMRAGALVSTADAKDISSKAIADWYLS
jgi:branched-chain amino acid transport system ATP-binding protein